MTAPTRQADPDGVYRFGPDEFNMLIEVASNLEPQDDDPVDRLIRKCQGIRTLELNGIKPQVAFDRNRGPDA